MEFVKKNFAIFFILVILSTVLTACGGKTQTPPSVAPSKDADFQGEGPVQGGIKSDEELAALEEEGKQYENENVPDTDAMREAGEAANVEMEGHEPNGTGNFQDYWQGDDYFDIEAYLTDRKCDYFTATNGDNHKPAESDAKAYFAYLNGSIWEVYVNASAGCTLVKIVPDENDRRTAYIVYDELALDQHMVTVNSQGTKISEGCLVVMDAIISAVEQYPNDIDPMQYFTLRYVPYSM